MDKLTDIELVRRCKKTYPYQTRYFEVLIGRYKDKVFGKVMYMLKNQDDAQDVCQDIFVKVFQGLAEFRESATFSTWLYAITVNTSLNHIDKMRVRPWQRLAEDVDAVNQEKVEDAALFVTMTKRLEMDELSKQIEQVFGHLSAVDGEILKLRFFEELDYQSIADQLGIGLSAVKMRIKRAREAFQVRFKHLTEEEER